MIRLLFIAIPAVLAVLILIIIKINSGPMNPGEIRRGIQSLIEREVNRKKNVNSGIVLIKSDKYAISEIFYAGLANGKAVGPDQPFHTASIGKAFTATLIGKLTEQGLLKFDDPVIQYLDQKVLEGLFTFRGRDYSNEVTIRQLLNHTSGAADYFEDKAAGSKSMKELIFSEPDRFWTPVDLLDFSHRFQKTVGAPGEKYHYSDTGYTLLGLIIESVTGKAFHEYMHEIILNPLKMDDSYVMFYSAPANPQREISDIILNGERINDYKSLSIDWAGGGLISTADDLASFIFGLNNFRIISKETLDELYCFDKKFMNGIHYGLGFMEYHFNEFSPMLKSFPVMRGHMGVLGTQMLYDKDSGTIVVCSFGSTDYAAGSVRTVIKILSMIRRSEDYI